MSPDDSLNQQAADAAEFKRGFPWFDTISCLLLLVVVVGLALPLVQTGRDVGWDHGGSPCSNNLRRLGVALHNYHEEHGRLPVVYVTDGNGSRLHSWRAQLLPYIEGGVAASQYDFEEPWNGPNNQKLGQTVGFSSLLCPDAKNSEVGGIDYAAVVGPETMWPTDRALKFEDVVDGLSSTIMQVEAHHNGMRWIVPADLELYLDNLSINAPHGAGIRSAHRGGANTLYGDVSVHFVSETVDPSVLRAMLTPNGKDAAESDSGESRKPPSAR